MIQLRFQCAVFFGWIFVFYNIERLHGPINIASFIYVLVALISLPILFLERLQKIQLTWFILPTVSLILLLKSVYGYPLGGAFLPITITEIGAVLLTIVLSRRIGNCMDEWRKSALTTLIAHVNERSRPFEKGQTEMYREIRRARAFHRPLALLAISPSDQSVRTALDRFSKKVQHETARHYMQARIAELLTDETKDCDIITQCNGHFAALMPETDRASVNEVIGKIKTASREKLGIDLNFGFSIFPDEEVTFVELLKRAEADLAGRVEMPTQDGHGKPPSISSELEFAEPHAAERGEAATIPQVNA